MNRAAFALCCSRTLAPTSVLAALLAAVLVAPAAQAQSVDSQLWATVSATTAVQPDLDLRIEWQGRFSDASDGLYESNYSLWLTHRNANGTALALGYQYTRSGNAVPVTQEHRLRQQFSAPVARFGGGVLSARVRVEERMRTDSNAVQFRLRPQIAFTHPLGHHGARWSISHESMVSTRAEWNHQRGLFRIRNQASLSLPLTRGVDMDLGYLNQVTFGRDGARDAMAHVGMAGVSMRF